MTLSEENDLLRKLLRKALARWGSAMPADVQSWWTTEQVLMAQEQTDAAAQKAAKIADLQDKITDLQTKLAALQ